MCTVHKLKMQKWICILHKIYDSLSLKATLTVLKFSIPSEPSLGKIENKCPHHGTLMTLLCFCQAISEPNRGSLNRNA